MIVEKAVCPRKGLYSTDKFWTEYVGRAVRAIDLPRRARHALRQMLLKPGHGRTIQSFRVFRGQNTRF